MICLVTDRHRFADHHDPCARVVEIVAAASRAGVDFVQVRERDVNGGALVALTRACVAAAAGTAARILVNDRTDVALAAGAHGVHLRGDSYDPPAVRRIVPDGFIVGRSVHGMMEAQSADGTGGLDYLVFGTTFATSSKDAARIAGVDELRAVCRAVRLPVLAIGGMTVDRAIVAARAGARGVAAIGMFVPPAGESTERYFERIVPALRRAFDSSRERSLT